jgi:integrase
VQAIELFLSSIRSPETKISYSIYFKKYQEFMSDLDLFCENNPRLIEQKIIEYLVDMKNKGKGYSTIHNYAAAVLAFYKINDVALNINKINRFIPEQRKVKKDRAYTHEEISQVLEIADERMKVVILLMSSSGIRLGALPLLKLRNLDNQKLTVYENERQEYFTFITPECKKAVDAYLDMRSRYGEKLDSNSPILREQFDIKDQFAIRKPKRFTIGMIKWKLVDLQKRLGIRTKEVATTHGFRKFFTTQLINSKVNPEIREMLLGHKIGLARCYYRPTEQVMYQEYEKAIDNLTIDPANRLQRKVEKLEVEKSQMERIELKLQLLEKQFNERNGKF